MPRPTLMKRFEQQAERLPRMPRLWFAVRYISLERPVSCFFRVERLMPLKSRTPKRARVNWHECVAEIELRAIVADYSTFDISLYRCDGIDLRCEFDCGCRGPSAARVRPHLGAVDLVDIRNSTTCGWAGKYPAAHAIRAVRQSPESYGHPDHPCSAAVPIQVYS